MSLTQWAQSFLQTAFSCKISSKAYQEPDPHDKQSALQQLCLYSYDYKCLSLSGARRFEGLITLKCVCVCVCMFCVFRIHGWFQFITTWPLFLLFWPLARCTQQVEIWECCKAAKKKSKGGRNTAVFLCNEGFYLHTYSHFCSSHQIKWFGYSDITAACLQPVWSSDHLCFLPYFSDVAVFTDERLLRKMLAFT